MEQLSQKVFCIGFHKTGTTSLNRALRQLGYHVCRRLDTLQDLVPTVNILQALKENELQEILAIVEQFDAFVDNPWPLLYKELDQKYPNSKFILSVREEKEWLNSSVNYFGTSESEIRSLIYGKGSPVSNEAIYLERYRRHNLEVKTYFKNRPHDLLILDIKEEHKWDQLCHFLGKPKPTVPYPFENKTVSNRSLHPEKAPKKRVTFKRILRVFAQSPSYLLLTLETLFFISLARATIVFIPFKKMANFLGRQGIESKLDVTVENQLKGIDIGKMIRKVSQFTPFRSLCFEQALACQFMLKRRNISSTIYFGLRKSSESSNTMEAHAWLRSGQNVLTGNRGRKTFEVISYFGG